MSEWPRLVKRSGILAEGTARCPSNRPNRTVGSHRPAPPEDNFGAHLLVGARGTARERADDQ